MPVVSQSIIRPIVPVGASTDACELRTPCAAAVSHAWRHAFCAASNISGGTSRLSIFAAASRCCSSTRRIGSSFAS